MQKYCHCCGNWYEAPEPKKKSTNPKSLTRFLMSLGLSYYIDKRKGGYRIKTSNWRDLDKKVLKQVKKAFPGIDARLETLLYNNSRPTTKLVIRTTNRPSRIFQTVKNETL